MSALFTLFAAYRLFQVQINAAWMWDINTPDLTQQLSERILTGRSRLLLHKNMVCEGFRNNVV